MDLAKRHDQLEIAEEAPALVPLPRRYSIRELESPDPTGLLPHELLRGEQVEHQVLNVISFSLEFTDGQSTPMTPMTQCWCIPSDGGPRARDLSLERCRCLVVRAAALFESVL